MSRTTTYNYLWIAAVAIIALMALAFNSNDKANLEIGIIAEFFTLVVLGVWRLAFHEEIKNGV